MQQDNEDSKTLNFNAPLRSTRRPPKLMSCPSLAGDDRIPFSWETAPGKPKESETPRPEEDVMSLSEAMGIAERSEKKRSGGLRMDDGGSFPEFIIQRFLPDAAAVAEASLRQRSPPLPFSPKGCGLDTVLFPWRAKHKRC